MNQTVSFLSLMIAAVVGGVLSVMLMLALQPVPTAPAATPQATVNAPPDRDPRVDELLARVAELEQREPVAPDTSALRNEIAALRKQVDAAGNGSESAGREPADAAVDPAPEGAFEQAVRQAVDAELARRDEQAAVLKAAEEKRVRAAERRMLHDWMQKSRVQMLERLDKLVTLHPTQRQALDTFLSERADEWEALMDRANDAKSDGETDWSGWQEESTDLEQRTLAGVRAQLDAAQLQLFDDAVGDRGLDALRK